MQGAGNYFSVPAGIEIFLLIKINPLIDVCDLCTVVSLS